MPEGDVNCDILVYNPALSNAKFQIARFFPHSTKWEKYQGTFFAIVKSQKRNRIIPAFCFSATYQCTYRSNGISSYCPLWQIPQKHRAESSGGERGDKEVANCLFSVLVLC